MTPDREKARTEAVEAIHRSADQTRTANVSLAIIDALGQFGDVKASEMILALCFVLGRVLEAGPRDISEITDAMEVLIGTAISYHRGMTAEEREEGKPWH